MALTEDVHLNDVGTVFRLTVLDDGAAVDLSEATTKQILFKKPSGLLLTKSAEYYTDGLDGIIDYTSASGDLSELGEWQMQAYIVTNTSSWHGTVEEFRVFPIL